MERRAVMKGAVAAGAAAMASGAAVAAPEGVALVHHVFFWLKNEGSATDRDALIAGLRKLAAIPTIRALHLGVPAPTEQRDVVDASWHVSELMFFDDTAGQKTYQDHPLHREFVATCEHLWRKVVVYDAVRA